MRRILFFILGLLVIVIIIGSILFLTKKENHNKPSLNKYVLEAQQALDNGQLLEAKKLYKLALENIKDPNYYEQIKKKLEEINIQIIFSPIIDECSIQYQVKPQDSLAKIAKEFGTTVELIKRSNSLKSNTIHPGQKLKVYTCKFSIVVDKSQNLLFLKQNDEVIKTYIVSTGKNNSTPQGTFKIVNKLTNPTWFKAGAVIPPDSPENILGSRWLGFNLKGYGIHGTTQPQDLGKQVTEGCVRMSNSDVEELYDIVPIGTEVTILD